MPRTHGRAIVFVDASNVVNTATWRAAGHPVDGAGPMHLVDLTASWAALNDVAAVVVFDGTGALGAPGERVLGDRCTIVATGNESADTWIEREAAVCRTSHIAYWLVTSDATLRSTAGGGAGRVIDSDAFAREVLAEFARFMAADEVDLEPSGGASALGSSVGEGVRERLERMRRGQSS